MPAVRRILRAVIFGSRRGIAGSVYGTIVVMGTLTAGSAVGERNAWELASTTTETVIVLWVAHVYAHSLGESLEGQHTLTRRELAGIARRELAIPLAAAAPIATLALGALDVVQESTAVWIALAIGVATLTVQGFRYASAEQLGRTGTLVAVAVNVSLGLVIVAMKAAFTFH